MNDQDDQERSEFPLKDETYQIIGCAIEVLNTLGPGFPAKAYENALVIEFENQALPYRQTPSIPLNYKETQIGEFQVPLILFDQVIVEPMVADRVSTPERGQMLNYLKASGLPVGLILNFKRPRLFWERVLL
jgi:GxxExxY protein